MSLIYPWQQPDWARLQELRKRPAHALLFKGAKGIGKFDLALSYARSLDEVKQQLEAIVASLLK